jgi:hypothetical protein
MITEGKRFKGGSCPALVERRYLGIMQLYWEKNYGICTNPSSAFPSEEVLLGEDSAQSIEQLTETNAWIGGMERKTDIFKKFGSSKNFSKHPYISQPIKKTYHPPTWGPTCRSVYPNRCQLCTDLRTAIALSHIVIFSYYVVLHTMRRFLP